MRKYIIYCTEEQTKKAIALGAPIKINNFPPSNGEKFMWLSPPEDAIVWNNSTNCLIPTAEQMIGWLEEQEVVIDISAHYIGCDEHEKNIYVYDWMRNDEYIDDITYETRKEATLAAIDAALEYLTNNKK